MRTIILLATVATACVGLAAQSPAPVPAVAGAADTPIIYIYRLRKFASSARKMTLALDGSPLLELQNGRYFALKLSPGAHYISDKKPDARFVLTLRPGDGPIYLRCEFIPDGLSFETGFASIDPQTATGELRQLTLGDAKEIRDRNAVLGPSASAPPAFSAAVDAATGELICPVRMTRIESSSSIKSGLSAALTGAARANSYVQLYFENDSQKIVTAARFETARINSLRELRLDGPVDTPVLKLKPGYNDSLIWPDPRDGEDKMAGWTVKVVFSDGTYWNDDGTHRCGPKEVSTH